MTRHDLRVALVIAAVVVAVGLGLGFLVGTLTRPDTVVAEATDQIEPAGFDARPGSDYVNPDGGTLPGYVDLYVNDYQDLLDPQAEARIRAKLIDLYDRYGIEMTVLTIQNMGQYGHHGEIEPFATALFNAWGIGDATRNDGVLVLVSRYDRKMRIEIGAGYDRSWDARMKRVIDTAFLPAFRADEYQRGIEQGVDETIRELTGAYPGQQDSGTVRQGWSWLVRWLKGIGAWAFLILAAPVAGAAMWVRRYLRNRPRPCGQCRTLMLRAGETADDEHLDGGQRLEEFLKSVDYDVWHCPECGHMDINRYKNWFSSYGACPRCNYRTLSTTSTVLQSATKTSTGRKRVDYDCKHCAYSDSETRTIPKLSDSSSSSGRSSFGGGSSSGGGASGSW